MKYFFDISISPRLVEALKIIVGAHRANIVHLRDRYTNLAVKDVQWISDLGKEGGWIIVSGDRNITKKKVEKDAWKSSGLTAFFLTDGWSNLNVYDQASQLIGKWPLIENHSSSCTPGSGFLIRKGKRIDLIF